MSLSPLSPSFIPNFAAHPQAMNDGKDKDPTPKGIANSHYAKSKGELVSLINEIRSGGAQLVVDLPRIAVIGNQSVGKSSLVEAISGINVPRDSGTCTRCPMEVRLQKSNDPWGCQVKLRFESDTFGKPLAAVKEVVFGPRITGPELVEDILRKAQLAILNPSVADPARFVDLDLATLQDGKPPLGSAQQLEFSPNLVCVDIKGSDVTDLAFGIVANKDPELIELVKNLVLKHIRGNCLILAALTMSDDIENQSAALLAKQEDPEGKRTIGVLTKADRIPAGEESKWLKIFRNQSHPLLYGYYCTKLSTHAELQAKKSFSAARKAEEAFFGGGIWAGVEPQLKRRLGTSNLTTALSDRLVRFIIDILPGLINEVRELYDANVKQIRELPDPPAEDPTLELLRLCTDFSSEAEQYCKGTFEHESLIHGTTEAFKHFKLDIQMTLPRFIPFEKDSTDPRKANFTEPESLKDDIENAVPGTADLFRSLRLELDLDDTRERIRKAVTRELPYNVPFAAKSKVILTSIASWKQFAIDCLESVRPLVNATVEELIQTHFGRFDGSPLRGKVLTIVDAEVERLFDVARSHIEWLATLDEIPYTQNNHYFSATREKVLTHYKTARSAYSPEWLTADVKNAITTALASGGLPTDITNLARLFPDDKYAEELITMAEARAFFQIAFKRIIDDVPRAIDADFIRPLGKCLLSRLVEGLGIHAEGGIDVARAWLAESEEVALQREELGNHRALLEKARKSLSSFGMARVASTRS
ncbi:hypothetical protein P7C70_g541, partial [Phenoliferia sp. Uapishka_3]